MPIFRFGVIILQHHRPAPMLSHFPPGPTVAHLPRCATVLSVRLAVGNVLTLAPVASNHTHQISYFSFSISRYARMFSLFSPRSKLYPLLDPLECVFFYRFTQKGFSFLAPSERFRISHSTPPPRSIPYLNVVRPALAGITNHVQCMHDGRSCL